MLLPESWRCPSCGCARDDADRARADAGLQALPPDAMTCGQACALAQVERELEAADAMMQARAGAALTGDASREAAALPRRAAYVHVVSERSHVVLGG